MRKLDDIAKWKKVWDTGYRKNRYFQDKGSGNWIKCCSITSK